jgi:hypothetical protein
LKTAMEDGNYDSENATGEDSEHSDDGGDTNN